MELYLVLSIMERENAEAMQTLYQAQELPLVLAVPGRGTATGELLDLYGLLPTEKTLLLTVANEEQTRQVMKNARRKLFVDIPGNGIVLAIPVKSVGGGKTLAYLTNNAVPDGSVPTLQFDYELILVVLNQGYTDEVMEAARGAGAGGGTVLHAKGTGGQYARRFLGVSLADEKEIILIAAAAAEKAAIMRSINQKAGPGTPPGAVAFSVPVTSVAGIREKDEG